MGGLKARHRCGPPERAGISRKIHQDIGDTGRGRFRGAIRRWSPSPAQIFGVMRARPVLEGEDANPGYIVRFVEATALPVLGLTSDPGDVPNVASAVIS